MRARLVTVVSLAVLSSGMLATSALGQSIQQQMDMNLRLGELRARQDMAERQTLIQQNQLTVLEGQLRTEQSLAEVRAQSQAPKLPPPPQGGPMPNLDTSQLASMPDDVLAASNARVKAAAENRR